MLPFWVHNTTLDETLNYKVDLYFWSGYHRWVRIDAKLTAPNSDGSFRGFPPNYPTYYNPDNPFGISPFTPHLSLPGPGSGVPFVIQATPDVTPQAAGRGHPFNWQPIAWHVDLTLDQLVPGQIHGIKLVLTCLDTCEVQDIKQLWFRMQEVPVY